MSENKLSFKRGDTFAFYANITVDGTTPLITDIANIRSQIRTAAGSLISNLIITTTINPGEYLFKATSTENWSLGIHHLDIEITVDDFISSSDTILVEVLKDITQPI